MGREDDGAAGRALAAWFRLVMAAPRRALAALVLLTAAAAALVAARLSVDTDSSRMLAPDLPFQARALELNAAFPELKNAVIVVVRSDIADAAEAAGAALAARLAARPEVAGVFAPFADPALVSRGLLYLDAAALDARLTRLVKASNLLAALRADPSVAGFLGAVDEAVRLAEGAGADTAALDAMLAEAAGVIDGRLGGAPRPFAWEGALGGGGEGPVLRVITVTPRLDFAALNPARETLAAVRAEIAALDPALAALVEVGVTGDPALRQEELRSVTETLGLSIGLTLVLVAGLLWLCFRSWARAAVPMAGLVATVVLAAGFAAGVAGPLNLISVAFVVLLVGLGIDFAIHLLAHLEEGAARGLAPAEAVEGAGRRLGAAFLLAGGTTALAFLAFTTTDFVGMAQLGLIGGAGVLIALGVTLTLIPAAVALRPGLLAVPPARFAPAPARRPVPRWVAGGVAALVAGAAVLVPQARFDADPMALRSAEAPSVVAFGWLAGAPRTTPYRLSLLVAGDGEAAAAKAAAAALPEVGQVTTLADLVPADQEAKLALIDLAWPSIDFAVNGEPLDLGGAAVPVTPASLAARLEATPGAGAAALAAALRRMGEVPPEGLEGDLFRFFPAMLDRLALQLDVAPTTRADLPESLVRRFLAADGRQRVDIAPAEDLRDPARLAAFAASVDAALPGAAGGPAQIAGAAAAVSSAMLTATLAAIGATALAALLVVRRIGLVAAILVPLGAAGVLTVGAGVLLGLPFNYANVIVLPLLIGYGVDTGVHIALTETGRAEESRAARRAVVFSALTTAAAFGTLAFSAHPGTASMGALLTVALAASMLAGLTLTPPLVRALA